MAKTPTLLRGSFLFVISYILIHAFHSFSSTALEYPDHAQSKESVSRGQRPRFLSGVLQTPNHGIALRGYTYDLDFSQLWCVYRDFKETTTAMETRKWRNKIINSFILTYVNIFPAFSFLNFLRYWQRKFVRQSRALKFVITFFILVTLMSRFRSDFLRLNKKSVTLRG